MTQGSWQAWSTPDLPPTAKVKTSGRFGPSDGPFIEVELEVIAHRGGRDVYRVTTRNPVDAPGCVERSAEVEFGGSRVVVYEDAMYVIVLDPVEPRKP